jgi:hypothetical protein
LLLTATRTTTYHRHEAFHSLALLESAKDLHMGDMEVDDDEWQLAVWYFKDQDKAKPTASLDFHQDLFAVTGTFRAQERDEGYKIFARDHFYHMFGEFPDSVEKDTELDQLVVCPFEHDASNLEWTSTLTGGHPLVFHFAGNDWLCACSVFAAEGYKNVPNKFRDNCENHYSSWYQRVQEGIQYVAHTEDTMETIFLLKGDTNAAAVTQQRRLGSPSDRKLDSPYPKRRPRQLDSPYGKRRPRELDSPYDDHEWENDEDNWEDDDEDWEDGNHTDRVLSHADTVHVHAYRVLDQFESLVSGPHESTIWEPDPFSQ